MQEEATGQVQALDNDLAGEMRSGGVLIGEAAVDEAGAAAALEVERAVRQEEALMAEAAKLASELEVKPLPAEGGSGIGGGDGTSPPGPVPIPPPTPGYVIVGEIQRGPRAGQVFAVADLVVLGEWQANHHDSGMADRASVVYRNPNAAHLDRERIAGVQHDNVPTCFGVVPHLSVREFRGFAPQDRYGRSLVVFGSEEIAAPDWMAYTVGVSPSATEEDGGDLPVGGFQRRGKRSFGLDDAEPAQAQPATQAAPQPVVIG